MTINKDTGQIMLFGGEEGESELSKVMHVEVAFDEQHHSYEQNFMYFVQYLYNGLLQIDIKDYSSGFTFGQLRVPLRTLIRQRRTELTFIYQDYIYHKNLIKGKMRLSIKAIRKMKPKTVKHVPHRYIPKEDKMEG